MSAKPKRPGSPTVHTGPEVVRGRANQQRKQSIKRRLFGTRAELESAPTEAAQPKLSSTRSEARGGASAQWRTGARIGQYQLIRELGRGGMGQVFLARDTRLERLVAIKFVAHGGALTNERFMTEARATAHCKHENIVVIHDVGEVDRRPYMVLEYVEGRTLRAWLQTRAQTLMTDDAVRLVTQIARGLSHAHRAGLVHRDLKPENVMLTEDGGLKILDFGIAKMLADHAESLAVDRPATGLTHTAVHRTRAGAAVGTLPYMSPEQLRAEDVDRRTDIWAVGIMLWELLVGRHPLDPLTRTQLIGMATDAEPLPSLRALHPDLGPLAEIADRCLHKHREERFASAEELLAALRQVGPDASDASIAAGLAANGQRRADSDPNASTAGLSEHSESPPASGLSLAASLAPARPEHPERDVGYSVGIRLEGDAGLALRWIVPGIMIAIFLAIVAGAVWLLTGKGGERAAGMTPPAPDARVATSSRQPDGMVRIAAGIADLGSTPAEIAAAVDSCLRTLGSEPESFCQRHYFEREARRKTLPVSAFYMHRTEVTNRHFAAWLTDIARVPDSDLVVRDRDGAPLADLSPAGHGIDYDESSTMYTVASDAHELPMTYVTFYGAQRYCRAQGARLPTEVEWAFAARGPGRRIYPWGERAPTCDGVVMARDRRHRQQCNLKGRITRGARPVTAGYQDMTEAGIHGLAGNVSEWTASRYADEWDGRVPCIAGYPTDSSALCAIRGGSWAGPPVLARAATRMRAAPDQARSDIGFRCVTEVGE